MMDLKMDNQLHATATAAPSSSLAAALPSNEFNKEDLPKPGAIMSDPSDADGHMVANGAESASSAISSSAADGLNLTRGTKSSAQATTKNDDVTQLLESFRSKNFAEKLHALLSVPAYQSILRWDPSGESFGIYDTDEFVSTVMTTHFRRSKFDSFTRRMRRWGFRRMESMDEKLKGSAVFKSKLFLRDKPEMCKMMGDDRQWKKKRRACGSDSPHNVQRLMSTTDMPSASLAKSNGIKDHNEPVPVHFPTGHPEDSHWDPSINTMTLPTYPPSSSPLHQLASTQHLCQPMAMNHFVEQAFPMGSCPPQDTRNIPGMIPMMQNGTEAVMHHYHNNTMLPYLHRHHHQQQHSYHAVHPTMTLPGQFPGENMMQRHYSNDYQGFNYAEMALELRLKRAKQELDEFQAK